MDSCSERCQEWTRIKPTPGVEAPPCRQSARPGRTLLFLCALTFSRNTDVGPRRCLVTQPWGRVTRSAPCSALGTHAVLDGRRACAGSRQRIPQDARPPTRSIHSGARKPVARIYRDDERTGSSLFSMMLCITCCEIRKCVP